MNKLTGNRRTKLSIALANLVPDPVLIDCALRSANYQQKHFQVCHSGWSVAQEVNHQRCIANQAFVNAIQCGLIAEDQPWMFMQSDSHHDYFKHKDTKEYIKCLKEVKE